LELVILPLLVVALVAAPLYQHAEAVTAKSVTGSGTGSYTCPATSINPSPSARSSSISFSAKGPFSLAGVAAITGTLIGLSGNLPQYTASGVAQINLCPGTMPGGSVMISGPCGFGVPITFTGPNVGSGVYTGNAICR
jgi:hypothetical protein